MTDGEFWFYLAVFVAIDARVIANFVRHSKNGNVTGWSVLYLAFQITVTLIWLLWEFGTFEVVR